MRATERILFITNSASYYRHRAFTGLMDEFDIFFIFFSRGNEAYRSQSSDPSMYGLPYADIGSKSTSHSGAIRRLISEVRSRPFDAMVKCINGKVELPLCFRLARSAGRPFVLWTGLWHWPQSPAHYLGRPFVRRIYRQSDAICTYGSHVSAFLENEGVNRERLHVVPQAVDSGGDFFPGASETASLEDPQRILFVGRLEHGKGLDLLIEAIGRNQGNAELHVVGTGPKEAALKSLSDSQKITTVWHGNKSRGELGDIYRQSDCVVIPSRTTRMEKEPWAFVANEAMLCERLVISSTAVGAAAGGLVRNFETGLVFEEGDIRALSDLLQIVRDNTELKVKLARAGREAAELLSTNAMTEGFAKAIRYSIRG